MARYIDAYVLKEKILKERDAIPLTRVERYGFGVSTPNLEGQAMRGGIKKALRCLEQTPTADVAPKSEDGAECPTCYGTGRIGTTNWLTKNISKKQLAEEKAKAIAEHEQYIKTEVAREIFGEIYEDCFDQYGYIDYDALAELKKKYTEGKT